MPSSLKKLSHTVYECKYHIIWCPKYRFRVMDGVVCFYARDETCPCVNGDARQ
ncbi:MAG: hypothetical protein M0P13_12455 [Fibrobacteraceae bacterium]|nr:hypothetical protein [Fibrobacteraceae bacterium]